MDRLELTLGWLACILLATGVARAQNFPTVVLPPVDLAATEVAQVSVVSAAGDYPGWNFTSPCQAVVTFYGADGSALGTPAAFTIGQLPQIFSAQLPYALTGATGSSVFVSAQISQAQGNGYSGPTPIPTCAFVFSLSTNDAATGVTHAFTAGQTGFGIEVGSVQVMPCTYIPGSLCSSEYEFVPAQVITLPPVNLAVSETVEVGAVSSAAGYSASPGICGTSTIVFRRADGSAIGSPATFTVGKAPQIFSAQLPYSDTGATALSAAISAQISLNVTPGGPVAYDSTIPPCVIAFSMKTFDTLTGLTHAFSAGISTPAAPYAAAGSSVPAAPEHRKPHGPPETFGPDK